MLLQVLAALALLGLLAAEADAARILAVLPMPARSHHIAVSGVTKALAERGHEVTLVTGLPKGNKINPANNKLIHLDNPFEDLTSECRSASNIRASRDLAYIQL